METRSKSPAYLSVWPVEEVEIPYILHADGEQLKRHAGQTAPLYLWYRVPRHGVKLSPRVDPVTGAGRLAPRPAGPLPRLRLRDLLNTERLQPGARLVLPENGGREAVETERNRPQYL